MAGDQAVDALANLRQAGAPVTEEPRAAIKLLAGLARLSRWFALGDLPLIEDDFERWGLPLVEGETAHTAEEAIAAADRLGYPVVVKVVSPGLAHKTETGGVKLALDDAEEVAGAIDEVTATAIEAGQIVEGVRVERYRPGLEMIVGGLVDPVFGPLVSVGSGGVLTELIDDVIFATAPVGINEAREMIHRLRGRPLLEGVRGSATADVDELARIVSLVSRGIAASGYQQVEINPLIWDGDAWVAVDWLVIQDRGEPVTEETTNSGT
jgi:succinyl-CoA synthetase beta subunit